MIQLLSIQEKLLYLQPCKIYIMETHKKFKLEQAAIKYYIFLTGIGLTAYCGLLCLNIRHAIAEWLSLAFAYILLAGGAWMFRLCKMSWLFLSYGFLVRTCMILHDIDYFGEYEQMAHYAVFSIGLLLCAIFILNLKKYLGNGNE